MMGRGNWSMLRVLALIALLVLALGVVACGDSDDSDSSGNGAAAAQGDSNGGDDDAPAADTPKGQVQAAYDEYIETFYEKDSAAVCDMLSQKGQGLWQKWAKGQGRTCESAVDKFFNSDVKLSSNRPYLVRVRLSGSRALAMAKTKRSDVYPVPMVKDGGQWKIDTGGGAS